MENPCRIWQTVRTWKEQLVVKVVWFWTTALRRFQECLHPSLDLHLVRVVMLVRSVQKTSYGTMAKRRQKWCVQVNLGSALAVLHVNIFPILLAVLWVTREFQHRTVCQWSCIGRRDDETRCRNNRAAFCRKCSDTLVWLQSARRANLKTVMSISSTLESFPLQESKSFRIRGAGVSFHVNSCFLWWSLSSALSYELGVLGRGRTTMQLSALQRCCEREVCVEVWLAGLDFSVRISKCILRLCSGLMGHMRLCSRTQTRRQATDRQLLSPAELQAGERVQYFTCCGGLKGGYICFDFYPSCWRIDEFQDLFK